MCPTHSEFTGFASLTVKDADGNSNTLQVSELSTVNTNRFELPPVFASDMFDVRFANNSYVANGNDMTIRVQGATFPMTLTSQGLIGTYTAINAATGSILGIVSSSNALVINNSNVSTIKLAKVLNADAANVEVYPNPASNVLNVRTATTSAVSVNMLDIFGKTVATSSINGNALTINTDEFANGTYTLTISVNGVITTQRIVINR